MRDERARMRPLRRRDAEQERQTAVSPSGPCGRSDLVPPGPRSENDRPGGRCHTARLCLGIRASSQSVVCFFCFFFKGLGVAEGVFSFFNFFFATWAKMADMHRKQISAVPRCLQAGVSGSVTLLYFVD